MSGRIRSVKPEWLEDEELLRSGSDARVLSVALMLLADDHGNGRCIPEVMEGQVFPFDNDRYRRFRESLARLSSMGFVCLYKVRGQTYFSIVNWKKHQRVDKPGKPRVPGPNDSDSEVITDTRGVLRKGSGDIRETLAPDHDHDHDHERERVSLTEPPTGSVGLPHCAWDDISTYYREWADETGCTRVMLTGPKQVQTALRVVGDVMRQHGCDLRAATRRTFAAAHALATRTHDGDVYLALRKVQVPRPVDRPDEETQEQWEARQRDLAENGPEYLRAAGEVNHG